MFNYNIIYTISMTIVTIGDKLLRECLSPQMGYSLETTEILGPCQPMEAIEL